MQLNQYFTHYTVPGKKNKIHIVMEHYSSEHQKVIGVISGVESVCVVNSGYGMNGEGSSIPKFAPLVFEVEAVASPEEDIL